MLVAGASAAAGEAGSAAVVGELLLVVVLVVVADTSGATFVGVKDGAVVDGDAALLFAGVVASPAATSLAPESEVVLSTEVTVGSGCCAGTVLSPFDPFACAGGAFVCSAAAASLGSLIIL